MKKYKDYLLYIGISLGLIFVLMLVKGMYPFGEASVIFSDMHAQVTAFYYQLYDGIINHQGLFLDLHTGLGTNFLATIIYYIASPFSFLVLLFGRSSIYQVVNIIVFLKMIVSGITALMFFRKFFPQVKTLPKVLFSLLYAFSSYSLLHYQITAWIDGVYLFPLLLIGLKKILDLEDSKWYIVVLTLALITSFYISIMMVVFVLLSSTIYLWFYQEKGKRKEAMMRLGISTLLSIGLSSFVLLPILSQILVSARAGFNLDSLIYSGLGPITDKMHFFLMSVIPLAISLSLISHVKKEKKTILFFLILLTLMLIPVIIEPVNKMWHLGSYAFFPLRFGFIPIFLILVMGMYAISLQSEKKDDKRKNNIVLSLSTLGVTTIILIFSTVYFYEDIQRLLDGLTISENKVLALVLYGQALLVFLSALWIYFKNNRYQNYTWLLLLILAIVHIESNAFLHIGMDFDQERLMSQYQNMNALYENEKLDHTYGLKTLDTDLFDNYGAVSSFKTIGHFTSLTNRDAIRLGKRLGYNSTWMKMSSYGANPLVDYLLGNRYMLSKTSVEKPFYKAIDKIGDYYVYESILPMSHGYMIEQDFNLTEAKNSFDATNMIYQALTGKEDTIFSIIDQDAFQLQNLEKKMNSYTKINKENDGTLTTEIFVEGEKRLYLEVMSSLDNIENYKLFETFSLYVNGKLMLENLITQEENGSIDLGTFKDEKVEIELKVHKNIDLSILSLGVFDLEKMEELSLNSVLPSSMTIRDNQALFSINTEKGTLVLPYHHLGGYQLKVDGIPQKISSKLGSFVGIEVEKGIHKIELTYIPKGLPTGILITIISILFTALFFFFEGIERFSKVKWMSYPVYYVEQAIFGVAITFIYILPIVAFCYSLIKKVIG